MIPQNPEKSDLDIYNANLSDSGQYFCQVVAKSGFKSEIKMFPINLNVICKF
jgi:hypothetical protein